MLLGDGFIAAPSRRSVADLPTGQALAVLHARHYVALVRLATALVDVEASAEEVVQEAFLHVLRRWDRLRDLDRAEAYLRRAVVNGSRDRLRRRRTRRAAIWPHAAAEPSAEDRVLVTQAQQEVLRALRVLPPRQREVLVLRYFGDLSDGQIAEALDVTPGTVRSTAHRGIAAMRASMEAGDRR